jgi:protein-arginine kinase activator protein McsA
MICYKCKYDSLSISVQIQRDVVIVSMLCDRCGTYKEVRVYQDKQPVTAFENTP